MYNQPKLLIQSQLQFAVGLIIQHPGELLAIERNNFLFYFRLGLMLNELVQVQ